MNEQPAKRSKKAPAAVVSMLLAALGVAEGRTHYAYRDVVGVLTVCRGITGPDVIEGKWYSWAECDALETRFIERMTAKMGPCVGAGLTLGEWKAWGHFTYNTGTAAFCGSTASRLLRAGKYKDACDQMLRWDVLTVKGRRVHCALPVNRTGAQRVEGCNGVMNRRELEHGMCLDAQADGGRFG